jgi:hypothetical protein
MEGWSQEEIKAWKRKLLHEYLGMFDVEPFPRDQALQNADTMKEYREKYKSFGIISPTEETMKKVAQCYLLSFDSFRNWKAISTQELVRACFADDSVIFEYLSSPVTIIYHGFDYIPNKLDIDYVNQIVSGRNVRGLPTLVVVRDREPKILVHQTTLSAALTASTKAPKTKTKTPAAPAANPHLF